MNRKKKSEQDEIGKKNEYASSWIWNGLGSRSQRRLGHGKVMENSICKLHIIRIPLMITSVVNMQLIFNVSRRFCYRLMISILQIPTNEFFHHLSSRLSKTVFISNRRRTCGRFFFHLNFFCSLYSFNIFSRIKLLAKTQRYVFSECIVFVYNMLWKKFCKSMRNPQEYDLEIRTRDRPVFVPS